MDETQFENIRSKLLTLNDEEENKEQDKVSFLPTNQLAFEANEIMRSNISHLPRCFLGLDMSKLGFISASLSRDEHPFFQLKKQALSNQNSYEDRVQALRSMCYVPLRDVFEDLKEVAFSFIDKKEWTVGQRFDFFNTKIEYKSLPNHDLKFECHRYFFHVRNMLKPTDSISLMNCEFLLAFYGFDQTQDRYPIVNALLDIVEHPSTVTSTKRDIYNLLTRVGDSMEHAYAYNKLKTLVEEEDESVTNKIYNFLRTLYSIHFTPEQVSTMLQKCPTDVKETLEGCILSEPNLTFQMASFQDCVWLILQFFQERKTQEAFLDACSELSSTLNSVNVNQVTISSLLNGLLPHISQDDLNLQFDVKKEFNQSVVARINHLITTGSISTQQLIAEALSEEGDRDFFTSFVLDSIDRDDLVKEFHGRLTSTEIDSLFLQIVNQYSNCSY
jgi:hypothetical protein